MVKTMQQFFKPVAPQNKKALAFLPRLWFYWSSDGTRTRDRL